MIAAERMLSIATEGRTIPVPVRIEVPRYDRNAWICDFSIGWPDGAFHHHGMGVDAVQAIHLALQMIAIQLYASEHHKAGTLRFEESGRGYGFPLPRGSRDMAVGDDKIF